MDKKILNLLFFYLRKNNEGVVFLDVATNIV